MTLDVGERVGPFVVVASEATFPARKRRVVVRCVVCERVSEMNERSLLDKRTEEQRGCAKCRVYTTNGTWTKGWKAKMENAAEENARLREEFETVKRERDQEREACAMYAERSGRFAEQADKLQADLDDARSTIEDLNDEIARGREAIRIYRTEAEAAKRERDEAQARVLDAALIHAELVRERDEARAEAERWKRSCNVFRERDWPKAFQATVTSLEREVSDAYEQLAKLRKLSKPWEGDAYRRGAEAMRKAAVSWLENNYASIDAEYISALPIPEET